MVARINRLRKHADYQSVYKSGRKQFGGQTSYFFMLRRPVQEPVGPAVGVEDSQAARIGITVGKVMGKAVDRNRIKRRVRAAVRSQLPLLHVPVDVVLHPRRSVIDLDFPALEKEVASVFRSIQKASERQPAGRSAMVK